MLDVCTCNEGELVVRLRNLIANPASYPEEQLQRFIGRAFAAPQQGTVAAQIVDFLISEST